MLPPDLASRLRLALPEQPAPPQPVTPAKQVPDVLSQLVPGQRILAEIQALLPNGLYRAVVGQRDITLSLPFAAKLGDTLELEVVESDGKVSLAFVANRGSGEASPEKAGTVATRLSQTGRLIGELLGGIDADGKKAQPAPLNGNQPLLPSGPLSGKDLLPVLREALSKSGMFYEAQQARWVAGKLPESVLLEQPQGKHSPLLHSPETTPGKENSEPRSPATAQAASIQESPAGEKPLAQLPREIVPLVQQQLDALSTQNYVWQGQAWPGQTIDWEISEEGHSRADNTEEEAARWKTRLKLQLPALGQIEATIFFRSAQEISIELDSANEDSRLTLRANSESLRGQMATAGLALVSLNITDGEQS